MYILPITVAIIALHDASTVFPKVALMSQSSETPDQMKFRTKESDGCCPFFPSNFSSVHYHHPIYYTCYCVLNILSALHCSSSSNNNNGISKLQRTNRLCFVLSCQYINMVWIYESNKLRKAYMIITRCLLKHLIY